MEDRKETFINILNHDLRTPLLAQVQSLKMLLNGDFGELKSEQKEILQLTTESCRDLLEMVSNVLTGYKLETREIMFNFEYLNIQKIIEKVCVELGKNLRQKNLRVEIFPSQTENIVYADVIFLSQAITHIVENCITYAHKNTKMCIKLHNSEKNLCITFVAKGDILPQEVLDYLFDYNSRKSLTHTKIGFGMKLNLALKILEAHSGGVVARNGAGNEIIFDIILPLQNACSDVIEFEEVSRIA